MSNYIIQGETLTSIADAIRAKKGTSDPVKVADFASEISDIETAGTTIPDGYILPSGTKEITENGTYDVKTYESVNVNVPTEGGGGDCTRPHVIEVDELPTENIDENAVYLCGGKYYKYSGGGFTDIITVSGGEAMSCAEAASGHTITFNSIIINTTEDVEGLEFLESNFGTGTFYFYYIVDNADLGITTEVYLYVDSNLTMCSALFGTYNGAIDNISQATADGYYIIIGGWNEYSYVSGALNVNENGSYDVSDKKSVTVSVPTAIIAQTVDDLPSNAPMGSIAYVLEG